MKMTPRIWRKLRRSFAFLLKYLYQATKENCTTPHLIFLKNHYKRLQESTRNLVLAACNNNPPPYFPNCKAIPMTIMTRNLFDTYAHYLAKDAKQLKKKRNSTVCNPVKASFLLPSNFSTKSTQHCMRLTFKCLIVFKLAHGVNF